MRAPIFCRFCVGAQCEIAHRVIIDENTCVSLFMCGEGGNGDGAGERHTRAQGENDQMRSNYY